MTRPAKMAQTLITKAMLKTADPTTVPTPMSSLAINTPIKEVANSGADEPAAMKVDPAISDSNSKYQHLFILYEFWIYQNYANNTYSNLVNFK